MTHANLYEKQTTRIVMSLLSISVLIWILLVAMYVAMRDEKVFTELQHSAFTYAGASSSGALVPTLLPLTPTAVPAIPSSLTTVPTTVPTISASNVAPTIALLPKKQNSDASISGKPVLVNTFPTSTKVLPYQRLKIALVFSDIARAVQRINRAQIVFYRQNNTGKWVRLPETKIFIDLRRIANTEYFENVEDIAIKIRSASSNPVKKTREKRPYGMYIKGSSTVGRFFAGILLKDVNLGRKMLMIDCGLTGLREKECGDLVTLRDEKTLFSGDSDGFLDASPSYNTVDIRDLEYAALRYHKKGEGTRDRSADYNQDGKIDDLDIAVIVANYGKRGDAIDE